MKKEHGQLFFEKKFAQNYEIRGDYIDQKNELPSLRVYHQEDKQVIIQIRTFEGRSRKMIAHCKLSIEELEAILAYAKENKY